MNQIEHYRSFTLKMPMNLADVLEYTSTATGIPRTTIINSGVRKVLIEMQESGVTESMKNVLEG
jgi:predicted DNA-binding protein